MQLLGRELAISGPKEEAVIITGLFSGMGSENAELFSERFKDEFRDLDAALAGVRGLSDQFFEASVKRAIDQLEGYDNSSFTLQSLTEYLKSNGFFLFWDDSLRKFEEKRNAIDEELQAASDDKKAAGESAKARVFELMEPCLTKAMQHTIEGFASALMSIIAGEKGISFSGPTPEEISRSKEIYDNVISGKIHEKDRVDAIFDAITLNPGNTDAFYFLVLKYGDSDCEIEKAGEHFGNPIGQKKLEGLEAYEKKVLSQKKDSFDALKGEERIKAYESLMEGFSNIKRNMGISSDLITRSEKSIEETVRKCREGAKPLHIPHPVRSRLTMSVHESLLPEEKLNMIREVCNRFKAEAAIPGLYEPTKKLIHYLELEDDEEIYLGHDKTILSSGKDGFAITNHGIICVSGKESNEMPYSELATVKNLKWANPDFKFDLMADGSTLIKCIPSEKDDILGLVDSIRKIVIS